jgi:hypothetical protein
MGVSSASSIGALFTRVQGLIALPPLEIEDVCIEALLLASQII